MPRSGISRASRRTFCVSHDWTPSPATERTPPGTDHAHGRGGHHPGHPGGEFPNGEAGFLAYNPAAAGSVAASVQRPDLLASDSAYYRTVLVVAGLIFVIGILHVRGKSH